MSEKPSEVFKELGILARDKVIHKLTAETIFHEHARFSLSYVQWVALTKNKLRFYEYKVNATPGPGKRISLVKHAQQIASRVAANDETL